MVQLSLKRLLKPGKPTYAAAQSIVQALRAEPDVAVFDSQGTLLMGDEVQVYNESQTTISANGQVLGWVCGPEKDRQALAALLEYLLAMETEKRELSEEVLDNYRELNLLYNLSERLISAPEPAAIANMALKEVDRLIQISAAWVLLLDGDGQLFPIAKRGKQWALRPQQCLDLVTEVLARSEAEILNNEPLNIVLDIPSQRMGDLICAPLKTEQQILGVILIVGQTPIQYQAHELKLLNAVALQVGPALEIARLYQVAVEKGRLEQELRQAFEVQASLIPRRTPNVDGWAFAGRWQPARELSGDYYDFIPLEDGCLGLVTGDVADKGMPSALFMVFTRSAVRSSAASFVSPAAAIVQANKLIAQESQDGLFVTLVYGCLDPESGQLIYVNAGHNPALLFDRSQGVVRELRHTGIPLGILAESPYREKEVYLQPGDFLIFYTDGVTDALNEHDEEFGVERLLAVIQKNHEAEAEEIATSIESAVLEFAGKRPLFDDLTLLIAKRNA
ncbi:MAG: GAF domain-containing SpoIIE family protein phosphatase [Candidatus Promineifilaceae bacterium]|nr:GAF domain-containing SpoIIE family protein phosphatase [Candidatus Promineifilaceae bacterium]